ncbi:glucose-6-phosphate dehydrogenase [Skermania sp. ID1734]|uniref:glucose-6-phosphate dehydrogenase n=1 Tax=Skermania sp. ID1734 TaxID=2597516 RepID=UPI00117C0325|nr:glucose-6-phosphate dehydrogenase [Skermania sp. ID1734]TSD98117.1 glucose-6-phosphate dehydrogenase [Skermania sp. ID1734]
MSDLLRDCVNQIFDRYFGPGIAATSPRMSRPQTRRMVADDAPERMAEAHRAALDFSRAEAVRNAEIALEYLFVTPHGLLYAAGLKGKQPPRRLYYFATPPPLFDSIVEQIGGSQLAGRSILAVDKRFGHDLVFPLPMDTGFRRILDDHPVIQVDLTVQTQ